MKKINPSKENGLALTALLLGLNSIRMSARVATADIDDSLSGEVGDLFSYINNAACAVAHLAAPENPTRSNELLESAGLGDLVEQQYDL